MSIIKLEVRLSEVTQAVEAFAKNRKQALEALTTEVRQVVSSTLNQLLNAEMELFLGSEKQAGNKRNGFREKEYTLKGIGTLRVRIPKDRQGEFSSCIIPAHERVDPRLRADMAILHLAGISTRTLSMISKRLLGVEVSKDTISASLDAIKDEAQAWLKRPLREDYWALYVDGTNFKLQRAGTTEREPLLVVLGVTKSNHRSVIAIEPGVRDDVNAWRAVFRELKARGLSASAVRIGIMDGLPGLESLFREEFPNAVTARCWFHAMRNIMAKCPARFEEIFKKMAHKVMYATSENDAREAFAALTEAFRDSAPNAVRCLQKDLDSLLVHYRFEERFWQALKTTNAIERINKEYKRRTKIMESLGESTLKAVVTFVSLRLEMGWRMHSIDSLALKNWKNSKTHGGKNDVIEKVNVIEKVVEQIGLLN